MAYPYPCSGRVDGATPENTVPGRLTAGSTAGVAAAAGAGAGVAGAGVAGAAASAGAAKGDGRPKAVRNLTFLAGELRKSGLRYVRQQTATAAATAHHHPLQ